MSSFRGRSESVSSGYKSGLKRSDSQETNYSGDAFYGSLQEDDYKIIDQTVESELDAEFDNSLSRYRTSSPSKRKVDELDQDDDQQHIYKVSKQNAPLTRSDSVLTTTTIHSSSSGSQSPPLPYPANPLCIVAFSPRHQSYFDKHGISWGAQWEIARLVTWKRLAYEDISIPNLEPLHGKNNESSADQIEKLFTEAMVDQQSENTYLKFHARELKSHNPWAALDMEEQQLKKDPLSGLGCNSLHNDWYGGNITFKARLRKEENKRGYSLRLEKPEISTSTRFGRRWGSWRFIRVRIPDDLLYEKDNDLPTFFKQDFVIHGRIYRGLFSKEHSVFLVELAERTLDGLTRKPNPTECLPFMQYLEWHNPMHLNKKQTLAKWCARMALAFSNSVPGLQFQLEDIHEIDDIYSTEIKDLDKTPDSKFILTDGTGYCNHVVLSLLHEKLHWDRIPSAIQFRIFGAKGLLILHPTEERRSDVSPQMWLRPSQKKINYDRSTEIDRTHLILDVLRRAEFRVPARLSTEIIVNLAENGVSHDTLQSLMNLGLDEIAASLTTWTGPYAMQRLWDVISKINGSVFYARAAKEAVGKARVLGLNSRDREEEDNNEEQECVQEPFKSKASWMDEISGSAVTLEEDTMFLLDSGFEPQSCGLLGRSVRGIFKKALMSYIDRYKIVVPQSGEGWMIPDPYGVLEPDQIFVKASQSSFELDGILRDHLRGPVLITRHPCRVPSDIQKVEAVWRDELARYTDVVVCSTRGSRSLASMLGGGDYDGDTAHIIWHPRIVEEFANADPKFADPCPSIDDAFQKDTKTVKNFLEDYTEVPINRKSQELQEYLLSTLQSSSLVGQYSSFHDVAVYRFGYTHDETWRLAYMFCAVLDSSKTGKRIKKLQLEADRRRYFTRAPKWKNNLADERDYSNSNKFTVDHPERQISAKFIMDVLKEGGHRQYDYHLGKFEEFLRDSQKSFKVAQGDISSSQFYVDRDLLKPAEDVRKHAKRLDESLGINTVSKEIEILEDHVKTCYEKFRELFKPTSSSDTFTRKPKQSRQDQLRRLSLLFHITPKEVVMLSQNDIELFKASYAYELDAKREKQNINCARFPFVVDMRRICLIKAQSTGTFKAVASDFYSFFQISPVLNKLSSSNGSSGYIYTPH